MSQPTYQWIISMSGNEQIYIVPGQSVEIGRKPLRPLPDNGVMRLEIVDPSRSMSKRHALFYVDDQGRAFMRDLQSTNGTYMIGSANALMKLSAQRDFMFPTSPIRIQFGDTIVADFIKVQRDALEPLPQVDDLFTYGHETESPEPSAQDLSVDDILNLRAGEPTSIMQVQHRREQDVERDVPGYDVSDSMESVGAVIENHLFEEATSNNTSEAFPEDESDQNTNEQDGNQPAVSDALCGERAAEESSSQEEAEQSNHETAAKSVESTDLQGDFTEQALESKQALESEPSEEATVANSMNPEDGQTSETERNTGLNQEVQQPVQEQHQQPTQDEYELHISNITPIRHDDEEHPVEHVSVTMVHGLSEVVTERDLFRDARTQEHDFLASQESLEQVTPTSSSSEQELTSLQEDNTTLSEDHVSSQAFETQQQETLTDHNAKDQQTTFEPSHETYQPVFEPGSVFARVAAGDFDAREDIVTVGGHTSVEARTTTDYVAQFEMSKHEQLRPFLAMNPALYDDLYAWLHALADPSIDEALASNAGYARYMQSMKE